MAYLYGMGAVPTDAFTVKSGVAIGNTPDATNAFIGLQQQINRILYLRGDDTLVTDGQIGNATFQALKKVFGLGPFEPLGSNVTIADIAAFADDFSNTLRDWADSMGVAATVPPGSRSPAPSGPPPVVPRGSMVVQAGAGAAAKHTGLDPLVIGSMAIPMEGVIGLGAFLLYAVLTKPKKKAGAR